MILIRKIYISFLLQISLSSNSAYVYFYWKIWIFCTMLDLVFLLCINDQVNAKVTISLWNHKSLHIYRFTKQSSTMVNIIVIVNDSNQRKDKKVGVVTQGRHLSDMGATFTLHCYFYPLCNATFPHWGKLHLHSTTISASCILLPAQTFPTVQYFVLCSCKCDLSAGCRLVVLIITV